jgi:hypothetical protein
MQIYLLALKPVFIVLFIFIKYLEMKIIQMSLISRKSLIPNLKKSAKV